MCKILTFEDRCKSQVKRRYDDAVHHPVKAFLRAVFLFLEAADQFIEQSHMAGTVRLPVRWRLAFRHRCSSFRSVRIICSKSEIGRSLSAFNDSVDAKWNELTWIFAF